MKQTIRFYFESHYQDDGFRTITESMKLNRIYKDNDSLVVLLNFTYSGSHDFFDIDPITCYQHQLNLQLET